MVTRSSPGGVLLGVSVIALFAMPFLGVAAHGERGSAPVAEGQAALATGRRSAVAAAPSVEVTALAQLTANGLSLLEERPDTKVNPGAVGDLVLGASLLLALSPEFRFHTTYWAGGRVKRGVLWGDLIVQGFGDPTVNDVRLKWIARQLALGGIERIYGVIRLDDGYFRTGAGEEPEPAETGAESEEEEDADDTATPPPETDDDDDDDAAFDPGPSALSYHHNRARLIITPGRVGGRAQVAVDPDVDHLAVFPFVETSPFGRRVRAVTTSSAAGTTVMLSGAVSPERGRTELVVEVGSRSRYFGAALYKHLRREGVRVRRRVSLQPSEVRRRWLIGDYSPPLVELLGDVLKGDAPDRGVAITEALVRTVAVQASGDSGDIDLGLETLRARLVDDVGLPAGAFELGAPGGDGAQLSPRHVVMLLRHIQQDFSRSSDLLRAIGPAQTHRILERLPPHLQRDLRAVADLRPGQLALAGYLQTKQGPAAVNIVVRGDVSSEVLWRATIARLERLAPPPAPHLTRSPSP